jgi:hypothetical protein
VVIFVTPCTDGDVVTATPATGFPERLVLTVPCTVPELVPGGPAGPAGPVSPFPQPKRSKAIEINGKLRKRYLGNPDKGRRFIPCSSFSQERMIRKKFIAGGKVKILFSPIQYVKIYPFSKGRIPRFREGDLMENSLRNLV